MYSKDILFKRILDNKCPVSNTEITDKDETIILNYNGAKLKVKKKYVQFNNNR